MKASRIFVTLLAMLALMSVAEPAPAQIKTNFVKDFLERYHPAKVKFPDSPSPAQPQAIGDLVRSGQLPLTMGDLINLILQNNLDIGVNRLSPLSTQFLIDTM